MWLHMQNQSTLPWSGDIKVIVISRLILEMSGEVVKVQNQLTLPPSKNNKLESGIQFRDVLKIVKNPKIKQDQGSIDKNSSF